MLRGLYRYAAACGYGAQHPGDVAAVANLVIPCHKRERSLALELRSDLTNNVYWLPYSFGEACGFTVMRTLAPCS